MLTATSFLWTRKSTTNGVDAIMDILQRDISGEMVSCSDPEYHLIAAIMEEARKITARLNTGYHEDENVRALFSQLTGTAVDSSFILRPPFYTDFGKNIRVGKNVFINSGCTFMDRGGIMVGEGVLIGPRVNIVTTNHPEDPAQRRATLSRPVRLEENVWVGIGAGIMPGVRIGRNSIVAAHAVVTRDVPDNVVVAGVPARIVKCVPQTGDNKWVDKTNSRPRGGQDLAK